jgi:hypothetical protein
LLLSGLSCPRSIFALERSLPLFDLRSKDSLVLAYYQRI